MDIERNIFESLTDYQGLEININNNEIVRFFIVSMVIDLKAGIECTLQCSNFLVSLCFLFKREPHVFMRLF